MKYSKLAILAATAAILTGCADNAPAFAPAASSLYITGEGKITSATVETYEESYYTAEELKAYVEDALAEFNAPYATTAGSGKEAESAAVINECTLAGGTAKLLIDFRTPEIYMDYMEQYPDEESSIQVTSLDVTTVADGVVKGYLVGTTYTATADGNKTATADDVMKQTKLYVAAVEGAALVQPDGTIQYISEGVTMAGDNQAQTPEGQMSYIIFK